MTPREKAILEEATSAWFALHNAPPPPDLKPDAMIEALIASLPDAPEVA